MTNGEVMQLDLEALNLLIGKCFPGLVRWKIVGGLPSNSNCFALGTESYVNYEEALVACKANCDDTWQWETYPITIATRSKFVDNIESAWVLVNHLMANNYDYECGSTSRSPPFMYDRSKPKEIYNYHRFEFFDLNGVEPLIVDGVGHTVGGKDNWRWSAIGNTIQEAICRAAVLLHFQIQDPLLEILHPQK